MDQDLPAYKPAGKKNLFKILHSGDVIVIPGADPILQLSRGSVWCRRHTVGEQLGVNSQWRSASPKDGP